MLFAVPFIGCWVPWLLPVPLWALNYGVLFAAGLFFTIAVEHLLPDSAEGFSALTENREWRWKGVGSEGGG